MVELFNRTLLSMLATLASDQPFDWEDHLHPLCLAYNTSVHSTTGHTPFYLMFGRQARMPIEVMYGSKDFPQYSPTEYAKDLRECLEKAYIKVREKKQAKSKRDKKTSMTRRYMGHLWRWVTSSFSTYLYFPGVMPESCTTLGLDHFEWFVACLTPRTEFNTSGHVVVI